MSIQPHGMAGEQYRRYPKSLLMRQVSVDARDKDNRVEQFKVVTTTLDASVGGGQLGALYERRWDGGVDLRSIKATMKMDVLRCQTVRGIEKELTMFLLVYNLVRMTVLEAAQRQGVPPERISFVAALRWLATAKLGDELPDLVVNPHRPGRAEPRVRKRRPKQFPVMQKPRAVLRQELAAKALGA